MGDEQRYRVVGRIAAGGMAEVFRGESAGIEGFRKKVAIKRVLPKLSQNKQFIDMFLDEARLGAYLNHSRCVQVFDIGQGAGAHFIVMEYVDGADLKGVLDYLQQQKQQVPIEVACSITLQICEGLEYAHNAVDHAGRPLSIVHRDISPHNVLMTRYGEVKLVDFGLAKAGSHLSKDDEDVVKGKFGYLAPEVTLGKGVDKRVDVFAAGILLWEMLCGRRLFLGSNDIETFKQVQAAQIPDPRQYREGVSENLVRVLAKALARDPSERYQSAGGFAKDLSTVLFMSKRAVTYHDVAKLVQAAARHRNATKKDDGGSAAAELLGDLIIEALHDFSGVLDSKPEDNTHLGHRGVEAGGGDFVDISGWGLDDDDAAAALSRTAPRDPSTPPPPDSIEEIEPEPDSIHPVSEDSAFAINPPEQPAADLTSPSPPAAAPAAAAPPPARPSAVAVALPWMITIIALGAAVAGWLR